ncbi:MAG: tetratricopeptide repeat protein, partial [Limisphaerales bacterium]
GRGMVKTKTGVSWWNWKSLSGLRTFVYEKVPFFLIAVAASIGTFIAQNKLGAVASLENVTVASRFFTAAVAYLEYTRKVFWPTDLAGYYEPSRTYPVRLAAIAVVFLTLATVVCLRTVKTKPYQLVGWLWFLGVIFPVSGLVQAGGQAMADRFTYIPIVGLSISLVWSAWKVVKTRPVCRVTLTLAAFSLLPLWIMLSRVQLYFWNDSQVMWARVLQFSPNSAIAHNNMGNFYQFRQPDRAMRHFELALQENPNYADFHFNVGTGFLRQGRIEEAIAEYKEAMRINPSHAKVRVNYGSLLAKQGKLDEAIAEFKTVLAAHPENDDALNNLGMALIEQKKYSEARAPLEKAVDVNPLDVNAENNLATVLAALGRSREAVPHYENALRLNPSLSLTHYKLGLLFSEDGHSDKAIEHFLAATHEPGIAADAHYQAALAYTELSNKPAAVLHLREAIQLKRDWIEPVNNLAWTLATDSKSNSRDVADALDLARRAAQLSVSNNPVIMDTLAAASARAQLFSDAVQIATQGRNLAVAAGQTNLAAEIDTRLKVYRAGKSYCAP